MADESKADFVEKIHTVPRETLVAYRDHGKPAPRLIKGGVKAAGTLRRLSEAGIDLDSATRQQKEEGVEKFVKEFDVLLSSLEDKRAAALR